MQRAPQGVKTQQVNKLVVPTPLRLSLTKDPLPVYKSASMYHVFITSGCDYQWNVGQRQLEDKIKWIDTKGISVASEMLTSLALASVFLIPA